MRKKPRSSRRTASARTWSREKSPRARSSLDAARAARQRAGEDDHVVELLLVAALAPARVVEVLLAAALVDAGGLDVAAGVRADPHVLPGRRDHQLVDARQDLGILDALAVGVEDREAAAAPTPAQAGAAAVDLPQARSVHAGDVPDVRGQPRLARLLRSRPASWPLDFAAARPACAWAWRRRRRRRRPARTASRLAFSALMRSGTGAASSSAAWTTISSPAAFCSIMSRTASR